MPKTIVKWMPSAIVEAELSRYKNSNGIPLRWELRTVKLADLKRLKSARENARFKDELNQDHVLTMSVAMEHGKPFPPIITTADLEILAGNHRTESTEVVGDTELQAYVVLNADKSVKELIRRTDNAGHGLNLSRDELVQQAIYLHIEHGISIAECSRQLNIKPDTIEAHIKSYRTRMDLEKLKINTANLHHSSLLMLAQFNNNPLVFEELGRTMAVGNLTVDQAKVLMELVKDQSSTPNKVDAIKQYRSSIVTRPRQLSRKLIRNKLHYELLSDRGLYNSLLKGKHGMPMTLDDIQFVSEKEAIMVSKRLDELAKYLSDELKAKGIKKRR